MACDEIVNALKDGNTKKNVVKKRIKFSYKISCNLRLQLY